MDMERSAYNAVLHCTRSRVSPPGPDAPWVWRGRAVPCRCRGCAGVAASSLGERGQSTPRSPKQSLSFSRACLKIAAWPHPGVVGEAALLFGFFGFFFFGGYFKNPHSHRCLLCPSLLWARTRGMYARLLLPTPHLSPPQQRNQGRAPPGTTALRPPGISHGASGLRQVTNCPVLSTRESRNPLEG